MSFILYRTRAGTVVESAGNVLALAREWDDLFNDDDLHAYLGECLASEPGNTTATVTDVLAPIVSQEVWAAGVTYLRSRSARVEESKDAGGGDFYDRVYAAERPEIFLKATPSRVVGHDQAMHLRRDSSWIVPEPELVLAVTSSSKIIGYTVGNDLSCRDIEGENPLYLPQAKTFRRCAALGPGILITDKPLPLQTSITLTITRAEKVIYSGAASLSQMKRGYEELVAFLFRDNDHPRGCMLMTGTGIVPPDEISLMNGDVATITIDGIGTLRNSMN